MKVWQNLLAVVGMSALVGTVLGQDRVEPIYETPYHEAPGASGPLGLQPGVGYPAYRIPPADARNPLAGCLNKHGVGCNAHHSWFGCGSFKSEAAWMWGSCRTFFQEPCFAKPPHPGRGLGFGLFGRNKGGCAEER